MIMEATLDTSRIIGHSVTHISYGTGEIVSANDKQVQVLFTSGELKRYQYPQAFISYLQIDDKSLMSEILREEAARQQKEDEKKKKLRAKQEADRQLTAFTTKNTNRKQTGNRSYSGTMGEPEDFNGRIIDLNSSFSTHAEALNSCFGYHYVQFQKAYKNLDNGYAVWFPRIARRIGNQYLSSDQYWGWLNIISENGDTITQMDNPDYPYSGGEPDKNKRIIFARFEGDNKYRFVGVYMFEQRFSNGESFKRIGTKLDTKTMKIIE